MFSGAVWPVGSVQETLWTARTNHGLYPGALPPSLNIVHRVQRARALVVVCSSGLCSMAVV
eukprot:COSAG01_NODE_24438_length_779_cov_0.825000_2_plen_60_part_01